MRDFRRVPRVHDPGGRARFAQGFPRRFTTRARRRRISPPLSTLSFFSTTLSRGSCSFREIKQLGIACSITFFALAVKQPAKKNGRGRRKAVEMAGTGLGCTRRGTPPSRRKFGRLIDVDLAPFPHGLFVLKVLPVGLPRADWRRRKNSNPLTDQTLPRYKIPRYRARGTN